MRLRICSGVADGVIVALTDVGLDLDACRPRLCDSVHIQLDSSERLTGSGAGGSASANIGMMVAMEAAVLQLATQLEPSVWLKTALFSEICLEQLQRVVLTAPHQQVSSDKASLSADDHLSCSLELDVDLFELSGDILRLAAQLWELCDGSELLPVATKKQKKLCSALSRQLGNALLQLLHRLLLPGALLTPGRHMAALETLAESVEVALSAADARIDKFSQEAGQTKAYARMRLRDWAKLMSAGKSITEDCVGLTTACVSAAQLLVREYDSEATYLRKDLSTAQSNLSAARALGGSMGAADGEITLVEERGRIMKDLDNVLMARELLLQQLAVATTGTEIILFEKYGKKSSSASKKNKQQDQKTAFQRVKRRTRMSANLHLLPNPDSAQWSSYQRTLDTLTALRRLCWKAIDHKMRLCTLRNSSSDLLSELRCGRRTAGQFMEGSSGDCWVMFGENYTPMNVMEMSGYSVNGSSGGASLSEGFSLLQWQKYQVHVENALTLKIGEVAYLHEAGVLHLRQEIQRLCCELQPPKDALVHVSYVCKVLTDTFLVSVGLSEASNFELEDLQRGARLPHIANKHSRTDACRDLLHNLFNDHMSLMTEEMLSHLEAVCKTNSFSMQKQQLWLAYDAHVQAAVGVQFKAFYSAALLEEAAFLEHAHETLNLTAVGITDLDLLRLESSNGDLELIAWRTRLRDALLPAVGAATDPCLAIHKRLASLFEAELNLTEALATHNVPQAMCADILMDWLLAWLLLLAPASLRVQLYLSLAAMRDLRPEWLERGPHAYVLVNWEAACQHLIDEMRRLASSLAVQETST